MVFVSKVDSGSLKKRWLAIGIVVVMLGLIGGALWVWVAKPWEEPAVSDVIGQSYTETKQTHAGKLLSRDTDKKTITLMDAKIQSSKTYRYDNRTGYYKGMNYDKIKLGDIAIGTYINITYNTETSIIISMWVEK